MGVGWGGSVGQGLDRWETKDLVSSTLYFWTFQVVQVVKNLPANAGDERDVHSITGSGRSPGEGLGNPLQYSCLEKPMDRGAWQTTVVYRVSKSWTWPRNLARTHTVFLHLNIRTRKLSQPPYPVVSWIFSIAVDRILGFKKNWIQGLKLNDILSLPLLSFLCLTLFSLLCFPLALVSGWFSVINGKMSMLNGIRFSSPQKSLQREQRHWGKREVQGSFWIPASWYPSELQELPAIWVLMFCVDSHQRGDGFGPGPFASIKQWKQYLLFRYFWGIETKAYGTVTSSVLAECCVFRGPFDWFFYNMS